MKGRGSRLSVVLWAAFAAIVGAGAIVLLRACGLLLMLPSAMPAVGWNFCPVSPTALAAEAERTEALRNQASRLAREIARRQLACANIPKPPPPPLQLPRQSGAPRPQQTALLKPPPPPPPPPKPPVPPKPPPDLPADRWAQKDLSMLRGCWVLGHDTGWHYREGGALWNCTATAGTLCLDDTGGGRIQMSVACPVPVGTYQCNASVRAQFSSDGTLGVNQPRGPCGRGYWLSQSRSCSRVDDMQALCHSTSENGESADLQFRRAP